MAWLSALSIQLSAQCSYNVTVNTADTFICNTAPMQLNAVATGNIPANAVYEWTPTAGLNNPNILASVHFFYQAHRLEIKEPNIRLHRFSNNRHTAWGRA